MVLATGPTGSGKTTTLYTMLDILNRPEVNISTVEDPIEYQMPRVNQTQVKPEIGLTCQWITSLLRQDPDIIMVGEIRDGETASTCGECFATGHLVLLPFIPILLPAPSRTHEWELSPFYNSHG